MIRKNDGKAIEIVRALGVEPADLRRGVLQHLISESRVAIEPGATTRNRDDVLAEISMHEVAIKRLKAELEEIDKDS